MKLIIYGADWCGDYKRARFVLDNLKIDYQYIDIDKDESAKNYVTEINPQGYSSIPVIIFPDKTFLIEPTTKDLIKKIDEFKSVI